MNDVDTYYLGKACKWWDDRNPTEFYYNLAEEMIDNQWTERITRRNQAVQPIEYPGYVRNIVPHFTPTKKKRKRKTPYGLKDTKFLAQSICKVCREITIHACSNCGDYLCHDKYGCFCLDTHCEEKISYHIKYN